jgi:hypothetical protein
MGSAIPGTGCCNKEFISFTWLPKMIAYGFPSPAETCS